MLIEEISDLVSPIVATGLLTPAKSGTSWYKWDLSGASVGGLISTVYSNKALGLTLDMNLAMGASDHNTIIDLGISSLIFCLESVKVKCSMEDFFLIRVVHTFSAKHLGLQHGFLFIKLNKSYYVIEKKILGAI